MTENYHKYEYIDDVYENLTALGHSNEDVYLVKNKTTGKIAVKKYVEIDALEIYEKLKSGSGKGIPKIYEVACSESKGLVIESYVSGETLEEALAVHGVFGEAEAKDVICQLLVILKGIHAQGLVHRDISAKNVILTDEGTVKLIDFGIAREVKEEKSRDTKILGTVGYAAPEQFGFHQSDARTDIYAVGVLFNQLLTGCMPAEQVYEEPAIRSIIKKSMAIDAKKRYASAKKMLMAIRHRGKPKTLSGIRILPGFRTDIKWKRITACVGYGFMLLYTYMSLQEFAGIPVGFFLEMAALAVYWWLATLLAANIGYWDNVIYPFCNWSKGKRIAMRVILWMVLFYAGMSLEIYLRGFYLNK